MVCGSFCAVWHVSRVFFVFGGCSLRLLTSLHFKKNLFLRDVLWCFAVFCVLVFLACFSVSKKQHNRPHKYTQRKKTNKTRFVKYSARRCCAFFCHSENVCTQHLQNTPNTLQNTRKTLFLKTHTQHPHNTTKHPQNTTQKGCKQKRTN